MTTKHLNKALIAVLGSLFLWTGCQDLEVENPNAPDRSQALANTGDVKALIGGAYRNIWDIQQLVNPNAALSVMADNHTASWGNFGMRSSSTEPRTAWNNSPTFTYADVTESPWYAAYGAIIAASDGMNALETVTFAGDSNCQATCSRAFARWMQGMAHAYVGLLFDKGFVVDETDLPVTGETELELQPYPQVMQAAFGYMQQALELANNNSFTLPTSWINGRAISSDQMARLINSYMARFRSQWPRSPDEADQVDWEAVETHVDNGIESDFAPVGVVGYTGPIWFSEQRVYIAQLSSTWSRLDLRWLGQGDVDGDWADWENTAPAAKQPFLVNTPDRRITQGVDQPTTSGSYVSYWEGIPFNPGRGTWHFSNYADSRWPFYTTGPDPIEITVVEQQLIKAEALLEQGERQAAADIINDTREGNGELPAVTVDGVPDGENCVPRNLDGTCGDLMEALQWEKRMETFALTVGEAFFDDRKWGDLYTGTPVHFPVPGAELDVLQKEIYTFGGDAGGAAPSITRDELAEMSAMERVEMSREAMQAMHRKRLSELEEPSVAVERK